MKEKKLTILNISDWHLLHRRTPTESIIAELEQYLFHDIWKHTEKIDVIYISGDVFDDLVHLSTESLYKTFSWFYKMLLFCKRRNIRVRVLEGTPSHDWHQSQWLLHINENSEINADLKYFQVLDIEHCEITGMNILYIPDEWRPDPKVTYKEVLDLMKEKGIEKLDFAVMHGCFQYQLHEIVKQQGKVPMHVEKDYLDIVKYHIMIGHVHRPSSYERILAPGSFSRLAHGEEEKKGGYLIEIYNDETHKVQFIVNEGATIYKTIDVNHLTEDDDVIGFLRKATESLPVDSHVRIRGKQGHFALVNKMSYVREFPQFIWSIKVDQDDVDENDMPKLFDVDDKSDLEQYQPITITRDNVVDLIKNRFQAKPETDPNTQSRAISILEALLNG